MRTPPIILIPGGPRAVLLIRMAYEEEGLPCPPIDERAVATRLLFPRSFVEAVNEMPNDKIHDYCFMGGLYRADTYASRRWILDFARDRFTKRSHLLISDGQEQHATLGSFDHTGSAHSVFVPRDLPEHERAYFNPPYFETLRHSEFTLCPAGDLPWSMRFFEAIMCRSIPVVADRQHTGRNSLERGIGYGVELRDQQHRYRQDIVEENFQLFLKYQTLISPSSRM